MAPGVPGWTPGWAVPNSTCAAYRWGEAVYWWGDGGDLTEP